MQSSEEKKVKDDVPTLNFDSDSSDSLGSSLSNYPLLIQFMKDAMPDDEALEDPVESLATERRRLDRQIAKFEKKKHAFQAGINKLNEKAMIVQEEKAKLEKDREALEKRKVESKVKVQETVTELSNEIAYLKSQIEEEKNQRKARFAAVKDFVHKLNGIQPLLVAAGTTVTDYAKVCDKIGKELLDAL